MNHVPPALAAEEIVDQCMHIVAMLPDEYRSYIHKRVLRQLPLVDRQASLSHPQKLVMVDDDFDIIGKYLPHLVSLTRGNTHILLYEGKGMEPLLDAWEKAHANITLMDGTLNPDAGLRLHGPHVIEKLREKPDPGLLIGFSGTDDNKKPFIASGVHAFVKKVEDPVRSVPELVTTLNSLTSTHDL